MSTTIANFLGINKSSSTMEDDKISINIPDNDDVIIEEKNNETENKSFNFNVSPVIDDNKDEIQVIDDNENEAPVIDDDEDVPDIELGNVTDIQSFLGNMEYKDVRKGLYKKYGLITKDEENIENVYMITYNKPTKYTKHKVPLTKEQKKIINQYRGVIVEKNTNRLLCYTFDKMSRHLPDNWDLQECKIMHSYDGTQIKLFYYNDKWIVSTTRRIDASKSYYYSQRSFMEMWNDVSKKVDYNKLDKQCCYSFVLSHPDNRIVTRYNKPYVTHTLTRNMTTFDLVDCDIGVQKPKTVTFSSKNDIWSSIKKLPYYNEGYVIQNNNIFIKVVNSKYNEVKELRGNSNSLFEHFFELKKQNKIKKFLFYYPEATDSFLYFTRFFDNMCMVIYNEYVLLRVRKVIKINDVPPYYKHVLYNIHGVYLSNKTTICLSDVRAHLEQYPSYKLKKMTDIANTLAYSYY